VDGAVLAVAVVASTEGGTEVEAEASTCRVPPTEDEEEEVWAYV
jgi:hypothetical protein